MQTVQKSVSLESAWANCPEGQIVSCLRTDEYDIQTGAFYSPLSNVYTEVAELECSLTVSDLKSLIIDAVHPGIDFSSLPRIAPEPFRMDPSPVEMPMTALSRIVDRFEKDLVFGGVLDQLIDAENMDAAKQVIAILASGKTGNPVNKNNLQYNDINNHILLCNDRRHPLQLLLPSFPFKDQNPFRTELFKASWCDLGEIALLARLHCIALSLNQVHPYDGQIIIVSDGRLYQDIFGIEPNAVSEYMNELIDMRNQMNMGRTVYLLDLWSIMKQLDSKATMIFENDTWRGVFSIRDSLVETISNISHTDERVLNSLCEMTSSMLMNLDLSDEIRTMGRDVLWETMLNAQDFKTRAARIISKEVVWENDSIDALANRAVKASIQYIATNITLKVLDILNKAFPLAIRGTVHSKSGQVAIPKLGRLDPWNGVGVLTDSSLRPSSIRVNAAWDLDRDSYGLLSWAGGSRPIGVYARSIVDIDGVF
ncbi:MAG: isocyanide synthase family protein [Coriobacteriia bacterium]|nr:isocyanide synthase family protein [Coriobacteriia bacterium]